MDKKDLKIVLIGLAVYVTVCVTEFCCICAIEGENTWNFLKEVWEWYSTLLF